MIRLTDNIIVKEMIIIIYLFFTTTEMDFSRVQGSNQCSILDVNPFLSVSIQREFRFILKLSAFNQANKILTQLTSNFQANG